jgi:hypothetical protein
LRISRFDSDFDSVEERMLEIIIGGVTAGIGYIKSRDYVARRLRYVEQARSPAAPFIAGAVATVIALPVVAILPVVGAGTAVLFGAAVGAGTYVGARRDLADID